MYISIFYLLIYKSFLRTSMIFLVSLLNFFTGNILSKVTRFAIKVSCAKCSDIFSTALSPSFCEGEVLKLH